MQFCVGHVHSNAFLTLYNDFNVTEFKQNINKYMCEWEIS